jgi:hypothetical protein
VLGFLARLALGLDLGFGFFPRPALDLGLLLGLFLGAPRLILQFPQLQLGARVRFLALLAFFVLAQLALLFLAHARLGLGLRTALGIGTRIGFRPRAGLCFLERLHRRFHVRAGRFAAAAHRLHDGLGLGGCLGSRRLLGHRACLAHGFLGCLRARLGFLARLALRVLACLDFGLDPGPFLRFLFCTFLGLGQGVLQRLHLRLDRGFGFRFSLGVRACIDLGPGPRRGFFFRLGLGGSLPLGFGLGPRLGIGPRLGLGIGPRLRFHRRLEPRLGLRLGHGVGCCLGFGLGLGSRLRRRFRGRVGFQLGFGLGLGFRFRLRPGPRFRFLADLGFGGRARRCEGACLGIGLGLRARHGLGIQLGHRRGRGEIEIIFCPRPRDGPYLRYGWRSRFGGFRRCDRPDVSVYGQLLEDFVQLPHLHARLPEEVGGSGLAVHGQEHHPDVARQPGGLVLDFQNALRRLGVDGLRVNGHNQLLGSQFDAMLPEPVRRH